MLLKHPINSRIVRNDDEMAVVNVMPEFIVYSPYNRETLKLVGVVLSLNVRNLSIYVSDNVLRSNRISLHKKPLGIQYDSHLCVSQFSNPRANCTKQGMSRFFLLIVRTLQLARVRTLILLFSCAANM